MATRSPHRHRSHPSLSLLVALTTANIAAAQTLDWLRATPSASPSPRAGHALAAYAPAGQAVLFGGFDPVRGTSGETWLWNGTAWLEAHPATNPPARSGHAMVYDAARQHVVLFGGVDAAGVELGDAWEWTGVTWLALPAGGPAPRHGHALAYDAAHQRVVLFGGEANGILLGDTWTWDGTNWAVVAPQPGGPVARAGHAMTYDAAHARVVLFGGAQNLGALADTWLWDGLQWLPALSLHTPPARRDHAMAYDAASSRVTLFGGRDAQTRADAWQWNGLDWALAQPGDHVPAPRADHAMTFVAATMQLVMFGGDNAASLPDTWLAGPAASAYGTGCGTPALQFVPGTSRLLVGQSATATIANAPTTLAAVAIGTSRDFFGVFPLPLTLAGIGMNGCVLLQSADVLGLGTTPVSPTTLATTLTLPNLPGLTGLHLYGQAYAFAPGQNPAQVIASNGIDWSIGYPGSTAVTIEEAFNDNTQLDVEASAGSWGSGLGSFAAIGGDGRHGDFDISIATETFTFVDGRRVYELDCDHTVIPAERTTSGQPIEITDGRFFFTSLLVDADYHLRFVGSVPAVVTVMGRLQVNGRIEVNGATNATLPPINQAVGQAGAAGGCGGGRGGNGGDRCLGFGSGNGNFDGRDGENVHVRAGQAYAGTAIGTGGHGAALYPASGLNTAQQFGQNPPIGLMYCLSAGAGGGGGGYTLPGALGQPLAVLINGMPAPNQSTFFGPAAGGGTAMQLFPFPPITGPVPATTHFLIGGSGGGGSGSNASLSLSLARSWAPGAGGGGGGGAIALRAGYLLYSRPGAHIDATGGSAHDNLGTSAGPQVAPAGGGSGGTVLLQTAQFALLDGDFDVRGGNGGRFDKTGGIGVNGGTIQIEGGDGAAGYLRLESPFPGTNVFHGNTFPPIASQNLGGLSETDPVVAVRSLFYSTNLAFPADFEHYQLDAMVGGVAMTFSDDPAVSPMPATVGAPVRLLFQAGRTDLATGMTVPVGPWRTSVRSSPGQTGISVDGGNSYRFIAIYDRTLGSLVQLDRLEVAYRD